MFNGYEKLKKKKKRNCKRQNIFLGNYASNKSHFVDIISSSLSPFQFHHFALFFSLRARVFFSFTLCVFRPERCFTLVLVLYAVALSTPLNLFFSYSSLSSYLTLIIHTFLRRHLLYRKNYLRFRTKLSGNSVFFSPLFR